MRRDLANDAVGGEDDAVVAEFVDGFQDGHGVGKFGGARREDGDHAVFVLHAPRRNQGEGVLHGPQITVRPAKGAVAFEAQNEDGIVLSAAEGFGHLALDRGRGGEQLHDAPDRRD